jgi:hypothetical protein
LVEAIILFVVKTKSFIVKPANVETLAQLTPLSVDLYKPIAVVEYKTPLFSLIKNEPPSGPVCVQLALLCKVNANSKKPRNKLLEFFREYYKSPSDTPMQEGGSTRVNKRKTRCYKSKPKPKRTVKHTKHKKQVKKTKRKPRKIMKKRNTSRKHKK